MTVTDIVSHNKKQFKIYVDHEFAFVLYKGELHKYGLKKEEEIPERVYRELLDEVLPKRAKLRTMNLLTKRPYSETKLREKLHEGMYPEGCIEAAIEYVKSYGYLDDESYARDYISYHMTSHSPRMLEQKLKLKGIDSGIIAKCLGEMEESDLTECQERQIRNLFQKKYHGVVPEDFGEKSKMLQYFIRKGYSVSTVQKCLSEIPLDDLYN